MTRFDRAMPILTGIGTVMFIVAGPPYDLVGFLLIVAGIAHLLSLILMED